MTKYLLFCLLIFSNLAVASGWKNPQPPSLIDGMIEDYVRYVPANVRQAQAAGRPSHSPGISFGMGLNIAYTFISVFQNLYDSYNQPSTESVVQTFVEQENTSDKKPDDKESADAQEALDTINKLSESQLKSLAELEELENSGSHYFRNKYAAFKNKETK
ncbi:MAG TPA: hypothetical protein VFM31_01165 [Nitrososphaeraceae archaeon]|nr:hypothetical protein [Nitrososphaeraceae archaeon]